MNNTNHRAHGVLFLILAVGAWILGMAAVMGRSARWGIAGFALIVAAFAVVVYFYCAKCTVRKVCSHVLPGYLTRIFPRREIGPYSRTDVFAMAAAFIVTTLFPLYWLAGNIPLLLVYCVILTVAVVDLRAKVCGDCKNVFCVLKKHPPKNR